MEKFNFLKFAKISCFVFGLSSLAFTSCKTAESEDGGKDPLNELEFPVLSVGDFSVTYPVGHTFGAWDWMDRTIHVGDYKNGVDYKFHTYMTMDTLSKNVRISYYSQFEPSTAKPSDVSDIANIFKNDVYSEDAGHEFISDETVSLGGNDARKLTAKQLWTIDPQTLDTVYGDIYKERYVFFDNDSRKIYSVEMEMPESLKASRHSELYGIVSSVKIKK